MFLRAEGQSEGSVVTDGMIDARLLGPWLLPSAAVLAGGLAAPKLQLLLCCQDPLILARATSQRETAITARTRNRLALLARDRVFGPRCRFKSQLTGVFPSPFDTLV